MLAAATGAKPPAPTGGAGEPVEDELPDQATQSVEVDMAPLRDDAAATLANKLDGAIGEWSMFHRTHGYYVQGVGRDTLIEAGLIDRAVLAERVEDMANADPRSKSTIRRYLKPFPG